MARSLLHALAALALAAGLSGPALAADFLSLAEPAVMYDAPSDKGKPLWVIKPYTPVEVVVNLERWVKARTMDGSIAWVQKASLSQTRTVVATALLQVRQAADANAPLVFQADKGVAMELLEAANQAAPGWAKVRHKDGQEGYVRVEQLWGL